MIVTPATDGLKGFDANSVITPDIAKAFHAHGYRFAVRYVSRVNPRHSYDLTPVEIQTILNAGLGLMVVQHVESAESWTPTPQKGAMYGLNAALRASMLGLPAGTMAWLDLEGVARGTPSSVIVEYCNAWHAAVSGEGYLPGIYVGWHCGLLADQLYHDLRFTRYWSAYNLNGNEYPAVRGVCMRQLACRAADKVPGVGIDFDVNVCRVDALGGRAMILGKDGWAE